MSGKIVGYRTTIIKRVRYAFVGGKMRKICFIDALIESLHSTKGWRPSAKKRQPIEERVWRRLKPSAQTFSHSYPSKIQLNQRGVA